MARIDIGGGAELAYEATGEGEPIVFIHGALIPDEFGSLASEPALCGFRRITYQRRGYGASSPLLPGATMADHAADCAALIAGLGLARAHVVGHSFGGSIALQLALDAPERVHSLVLLEPGMFLGNTAGAYRAALADNQRRYREVGAEAMVTDFFKPRFGPDWRARFDREHPELVAQAIRYAATFFEHEIGAVGTWSFGERDLPRIPHPTLAVLGAVSDGLWDRFGETQRVLLRSMPRAEGFVLPRASHAMQLDNPCELAVAIGAFCERQRR